MPIIQEIGLDRQFRRRVEKLAERLGVRLADSSLAIHEVGDVARETLALRATFSIALMLFLDVVG